MLTVLGAGSVGLSLGARLRRAGEDVLFVVRDPAQAAELRAHGVGVDDPGSGASFHVKVRATVDLARDGARIGDGPVLVCVRATGTAAVARTLAVAAPEATVVSVQNDVDNEAELAAHCPQVIGAVYRQTCTRIAPATVRALGSGRIVVGLHPEGRSPEVDDLAERLRAAGYDVGVSERIGEDKWLKLCVNLMSTPNALVRRADHTTPEFVEVKTRLLEEARDALAAAGIVARSCDGRDRGLDEEIAFQRTALERGASARRLPVYNQVWRSLRDGGPLEADRYHARIVSIARANGLAAPANEQAGAAVLRAWREGLGPESLAARDLLP